jgi:hypothetical protein
MGIATNVRYQLATLLGRRVKPNLLTSRRIYTYTDKVFRSSGGAPDKLVDLYKAHTARHRD